MSSKSALYRKRLKENNDPKYQEYLKRMKEREQKKRDDNKKRAEEEPRTRAMELKHEARLQQMREYRARKKAKAGIQTRSGSQTRVDPHRKNPRDMTPEEFRLHSNRLRQDSRARMSAQKRRRHREKDREYQRKKRASAQPSSFPAVTPQRPAPHAFTLPKSFLKQLRRWEFTLAMAVPQQTGKDYFNSYCDLGVHELMLQDRPRTTFYRKFFEMNQDFVKGKVVMDVGAGTGILSLFAATAGAKKVYAVEASEVASLCQEIVQDNGFESVIEVIHGAVEDISLPEGVQVDIIVSEWMGFYLLHESMLESVFIARDKFLAPSGVLVPSKASLYMAPVDMSEHFQDRTEYWSNIYGYDFSPIASTINIQEVSKPLIKVLPPSTIKSEAAKLLDLNLTTASVEDVKSFSQTCQFSISEESRIHGFAVWFDVDFEVLNAATDDTTHCESRKSLDSQCPVNAGGDATTQNTKNCDSKSVGDDSNSSCVCLSTSPFSPATHWKQTVIFLPQTIMVVEDVVLCCKVKMLQDSSNKRHYNISIELKDENDLNDDIEAEDDDNSVEEGDSDDSCDHPVPCNCGSNRCRLISALVEKYDTEHQELVDEAEMVETEAEVEAAKEIDTAIESEGWPLDMSGTDGVDSK